MKKTLIASAIALAFGASAPLLANPTNTADSNRSNTRRQLRPRPKAGMAARKRTKILRRTLTTRCATGMQRPETVP